MSDYPLDMPVPEFRRAGHDVIDWIGDYLEGFRDLPVLPAVQPGEIAAKLAPSAPVEGESIEDILADFRNVIVPGNTQWNHPRFHAWFSVSASGPGILAEALTAALNVNGMLWKSSPSFTELEVRVLAWLREWLGLPPHFFGVIYDTASTSTMHAMIAAREYVDPESRTRGMRGDLTVYTSVQAHSSVEKGAMAVGFGQDNVRKIAVDAEFRMIPDQLEAALKQDVAAGKRPACVVPSLGTTSTSSIDPVGEIIEIARRYGAWVHVDGAYGGPAAILEDYRWMTEQAAGADSIVVNPHKWLFTPIDCSVFYMARPEILRRALALSPEYLRTAQDDVVVNLNEYGVPLGRRFRSLKLWFVMRYFGLRQIRAILGNHIRWAREFASWIEGSDEFELAAPVPLSLVCFRLKGSDEENRALMDRINSSGVAFLSHTVLNGKLVLRMALGNLRTTREDVELLWQRLQAEAAPVL